MSSGDFLRLPESTIRLSEVAFLRCGELDDISTGAVVYTLEIRMRSDCGCIICECATIEERDHLRGAIESALGYFEGGGSVFPSAEQQLADIRSQCVMAGCDNPCMDGHVACIECFDALAREGEVGDGE